MDDSIDGFGYFTQQKSTAADNHCKQDTKHHACHGQEGIFGFEQLIIQWGTNRVRLPEISNFH
ncbi:MAG: hypothetical protein JRE28_06560 [Deltaproteobacteria bacterium]|nr:hypothetical protein [Deltaproteobacteria bacterium]